MGFIGARSWLNAQEASASIAVADTAFRTVAALIDLDHVMDTGERVKAFDRLAIESERLGLDPMIVAVLLHEMYPGLMDITPPPHDEPSKAVN